jgi:hypothetical protein
MWIMVFGLIAAVVTLAASVTTVYLMRENALRKEMQALDIASLLLAEDADQKLLNAQLLLDVLAERASTIAKKSTPAGYDSQLSQADAFQFLRDRQTAA